MLSSESGAFGEDVPSNLASPFSKTATENLLYLLNTELKEDAYLTGLEFYSVGGPFLELKVSFFSKKTPINVV